MTLKTDLYTLMQPIIGGTVIWMDQNTPRPALPYSAMKVTSMTRVGFDHYSDAPAGVQTVKGDREFVLNVQRFGPDSVEALQAVADKLRLTTNIDKFIKAKLPVIDAESVTDVAALLDQTKIEPRASLDVRLRLKSSLTDNVGYIDTVVIDADIGGTTTVIEIQVSLAVP